MIQSISYNLTDKESTLLKVSAKMFEERYIFISFIESRGIRSLIDHGSNEYKLDLSGFPKTEEGEIQKIWYKLLYIMSAFHNHIDFKALIHENVKKMTRSVYKYDYYEKSVKDALAEYILFLRTGKIIGYDQRSDELVGNMTIDEMVDLIKDELSLRTKLYKNNNEMIVEIATIHYDYNEINKAEGYIKYITTAEHTKLLLWLRGGK